jgi:hypothetical protein
MALWNSIDSGLYTPSGTSYPLWLPSMSLKLMGRDWAAFTKPFDFYVSSHVPGGGSWADFFDLSVCYPTNWGIDETYVVAIELGIRLRGASIPVGDTVTLRLENGNNTSSIVGGGGGFTLTKVYTDAATLPSGVTVETVQQEGDGGGTVSRPFGFYGPDSYIRAYVV